MKYTDGHEWVKIEDGNQARVGISDFAQKELGEVVYVELPTVGHVVSEGDQVVVLESTKAAVDIYSPVSGEILSVNSSLLKTPGQVNLFPEGEGWLFTIRLSHPEELDSMMDESKYRTFFKSNE